ncbi:MAG: mucoidy inhibitor MuiA family protein [Acidimicrobiales bacterium]
MAELEAPIVAVTVHPEQARVTRRGEAAVTAGASTVVVDGLPVTLVDESVRVAGRGAGARIVGVEVTTRHHADAPDPVIAGFEARLRALRDEDQAAADRDAAEGAEGTFLEALARRGGASLAKAIAAGQAGANAVATFGETVREGLAAVGERRRDLARQREDLARQIAATEADLAHRQQQRGTARRAVEVSLEAEADTAVELDITYVVHGAGWRPVYDARLDGSEEGPEATIRVDWHGLVTQRTGEDWPAVPLTLSTARAAVHRTIPELHPWYVDVWRPPPQPVARAKSRDAAGATLAAAPMAAPEMQRPDVADVVLREAPAATAEAGTTAVSYRLSRPVAVPSDGSPHRATITNLDLPARLDFVAVPKLAAECYLRATVTNTSGHTLLPGTVSVFSGADFVGTSELEILPSGGEVELQLGVDDRMRVERELTRRETSKTLVGGNRRTGATYTTTVENHRAAPVRVAVIDQFPVSRHEQVKVRDAKASPDPAERSDLDVVTWRFELAPGAKQELALSFTLEHPRDLQLTGWHD